MIFKGLCVHVVLLFTESERSESLQGLFWWRLHQIEMKTLAPRKEAMWTPAITFLQIIPLLPNRSFDFPCLWRKSPKNKEFMFVCIYCECCPSLHLARGGVWRSLPASGSVPCLSWWECTCWPRLYGCHLAHNTLGPFRQPLHSSCLGTWPVWCDTGSWQREGKLLIYTTRIREWL